MQTVTEGAACTVLLAERFIDNDDPLMIANSDQWVGYCIDDYLAVMEKESADGLIMTMKSHDPKWSFVEFAPDGSVAAVREKKPVSDEATVGIYNFRHGKDYVRCAKEMIQAGHRENGEFYVAPVYDYMVQSGKKIASAMYGLGIPPDLDAFIGTAACDKAVKCATQKTVKRA